MSAQYRERTGCASMGMAHLHIATEHQKIEDIGTAQT